MKGLVFLTGAAVTVAAIAIWYVLGGHTEDLPIPPPKAEYALEDVLPGAEKGVAADQYRVARLYHRGRGVKRDMGEALRWYTKAAKQWHVPSQVILGRLNEGRDGVRENQRKAAEWYKAAAEFGNSREAQFALGQMYYSGRGVTHDYATAIKWYAKAAERDHGAAQYLLGTLYWRGWGVERDLPRAYMWLTLAHPKAEAIKAIDAQYAPERNLAKLKADMNRHQTDQGKKLLRKWRKRHGKK